eukprot:TRINITY_DN4269_c0_g3_i1.p1 TRINITY_DN4269_c0_g3~~TRINITY_DN4269_c0_g3_i1.p1  ORF type:complete len:176 (-),score=58.88 TRINITY_DN4269_c0_g3_i1:459-986(-)
MANSRGIVLGLVLVLMVCCSALLSDEEISKMSVKQLKEFMKQRQLDCSDCVEKSHLIQFVKDHRDVPVVAQQDSSTSHQQQPPSSSDDEQGTGDDDVVVEDVDDILSMFKNFQTTENANPEVKKSPPKPNHKNPTTSSSGSGSKKPASSTRTFAGVWAGKAKKVHQISRGSCRSC